MNWLSFAIALWLGLGLELGLRSVFLAGGNTSAPSFLIPLVIYVALHAPNRPAIWAAIITGVLIDLSWKLTREGGGEANIVGPYALGLLLAAQLTLLTRGSVMRKHPVTLAVLSIMAAIVAHAVVVAIISLRGFYDGVEGWRPAAEIGSRMISALFTGGAALVMAFLLNLIEPMFGFQSDRSRRRY